MAGIHFPQINVDELAARIRKAITQSREKTVIDREAIPTNVSEAEGLPTYLAPKSTSDSSATPAPQVDLPRFKSQPDFEPNTDDHYHVDDLLKYHDRAFIQNAYRAILKRDPDMEGYARYLESLRSARANKIDILASLRFSTEGRLKAIRIDGLALPSVIRRFGRLPVIGYPVRLAIGLVRLPNLIRHQQQFEAYSLVQNQELARHVNRISELLTEHFNKVSLTLADLLAVPEVLSNQQQQIDQLVHQEELLSAQVSARLNELGLQLEARIVEEKVKGLEQMRRLLLEQEAQLKLASQELKAQTARIYEQLQQTRSELTLQGSRVTLMLEEAHKQLSEPPRQQPLQAGAVAEEHHSLDALYTALEDRFRGNREEIKERNKDYLPRIKSAVAATHNRPVVDLGCGRGEWLELLKEEGLKAIGVDTNRVMIEQCRERGLEVFESDVLAYLRSLPDDTLSAVTGFHIVEHLPIEALIKLLDEVVRVLSTGAVVIFETPNPDNVLVGSNYFYFDPTHRNPLPGLLMQFLFEARGLHRIEVMNLHPWDAARVDGDDNLTARFNELFYGPMDYAIVGWKP